MTPDGKLVTLYAFNPLSQAGGSYPEGGLVRGRDGDFYGTTGEGGASGEGTVFRITPGGKLILLHSFHGDDGDKPMSALVQGRDGNFYGTTQYGGPGNQGTVFRITPGGTLITLHAFSSLSDFGAPNKDGAGPIATMVQGRDGNFYGTTFGGGATGNGTIFKITPRGTLTTLHSFTRLEGDGPLSVIQGSDGNLYGVVSLGGTDDKSLLGGGTVFKLTLH